VKSPASPTINQLGFRDVGKSGVAFSRRVSGCSNRAGPPERSVKPQERGFSTG
jgi:hypothetical protein